MAMKKCSLLFTFLSILSFATIDSAASDAKPWTAWRNALKPQGESGEPITLAVDGTTDYVIVTRTTPPRKNAKRRWCWPIGSGKSPGLPFSSKVCRYSRTVIELGVRTLVCGSRPRVAGAMSTCPRCNSNRDAGESGGVAGGRYSQPSWRLLGHAQASRIASPISAGRMSGWVVGIRATAGVKGGSSACCPSRDFSFVTRIAWPEPTDLQITVKLIPYWNRGRETSTLWFSGVSNRSDVERTLEEIEQQPAPQGGIIECECSLLS